MGSEESSSWLSRFQESKHTRNSLTGRTCIDPTHDDFIVGNIDNAVSSGQVSLKVSQHSYGLYCICVWCASCKLIRTRLASGRETQTTSGNCWGSRGCNALTLHHGPLPRMIYRWTLPPFRRHGGHCPPVRVARRRWIRPYHIVRNPTHKSALQPGFIRMLLSPTVLIV